MASTSSAISQANQFLAPVLNPDAQRKISSKNVSLIGELYRGSLAADSDPQPDLKNIRRAVICKALSLLQQIHAEILASQLSNAPQNTANNRTINALLDLLVLEGIYSLLSRGVGIPIEIRVRNAIFFLPILQGRQNSGQRIQGPEEEAGKDVELLGEVVDGLMEIISTKGGERQTTAEMWKRRFARGIKTSVQERCLHDILAGCAELAFNPDMEGGSGKVWVQHWERLTDSLSTPQLLPTILSLLHPLTPPWLRVYLTKTLSFIPLTRPQAVRDILHLFLSRASSGNTASSASSQLSIEALSKASQILGAVPKSVSLDEYFSKVCPQLLELLDGNNMALAKAAGFVLGEMLGRRGALEQVIEREVVVPILAWLNPEAAGNKETKLEVEDVEMLNISSSGKKTSSALLAFEDSPPCSPKQTSLISEIPEESPDVSLTSETPHAEAPPSSAPPLIPESTLSLSLRRIEILLSAHPTPSIPARIISPVLLPLWGLLCYAKITYRTQWYSRVSSILKCYLTTASSAEGVLETIQKHLLFPAESAWEFGPGSEGGIEIRRKHGKRKQVKGLEGVNAVEERIEEFMMLLTEEGVNEAVINEFFLRVLREWLQRRSVEGKREHLDPIKMLIDIKILQEIVSGKQDVLARNPTQTLQIVKGVLDEFVEWHKNKKAQENETINASLGDLGKIVRDPSPPLPQKRPATGLFTGEGEEDDDLDEESQRIQTVNMALSLLTVFLTTPSKNLSLTDYRLISTLQPSLSYISKSHTIDDSLTSLATNIITLTSMQNPSVSSPDNPKASFIGQQKAIYAQALSFLGDPLVPVRAHGLHLFRELILARSPIIEIPSTMKLLITMLKDGDSFVYLNVVKCLSALTDRHSNTVTKMLTEAYIDEIDVLGLREAGKSGGVLGLDERLRIGEALLVTVQRLGEALVEDLAEFIARSMLAVVSRRKKRIEDTLATATKLKPTAEADEEPEELVDDAGNPLSQAEVERIRHAEKIVSSWPGVSQTEDLRIRTSALSILSAVIETNASGLPPRTLVEIIDTCLAILSLETAMEKSIFRRAAVVCLGSFAKSLHQAWKGRVWGVLKGRIKDVERVLGYVRVSDTDGLVREQAGLVNENFAALLENVMVGRIGSGQGEGSRGILDIETGRLGDNGIETLK